MTILVYICMRKSLLVAIAHSSRRSVDSADIAAIRYRLNDGLFNLLRLQAKPKLSFI